MQYKECSFVQKKTDNKAATRSHPQESGQVREYQCYKSKES